MSPNRYLAAPVIVLALGLTTCASVQESIDAMARAAGRGPREECPNVSAKYPDGRSESHLEQPDSSSVAVHDPTIVPRLARSIAFIPEYHDCQRLIVGNAPQVAGNLSRSVNAYGPLVGIFANEILGEIPPARFRDEGGMPVAQLYNFSKQPYGVLGILPEFNCLYLRLMQNGTWEATMWPTRGKNDCPIVTSWPAGHRLHVTPGPPATNSDDIPPVARWDWDGRSNRNYIGIKCANSWCEIGIPPVASSPTYGGNPMNRVKGWYDEQSLAVPDANRVLWPRVNGRVVPEPTLGDLTEDSFTCNHPCDRASGWVKVATVHIDSNPYTQHYTTKMNFTAGANEIYLRRKVRTGAEVWQARIISATGIVAYRKTLRVEHDHRVPPTARWHWREDDERMWQRCALGCCESGEEVINPDDWR